MNLTSVRITNFRSVEDSGEFDVGDLLCLVGKNEAGKSAVLQALAGLNPHPATPFRYDIERDYPRRHLSEYVSRHNGEPATVIDSKWSISSEQISIIEAKLGKNVLTSTSVTLSRAYGSEIQWDIPLDGRRVISNLLEKYKLNAAEAKQIGSPPDLSNLRNALQSLTTRSTKLQKMLDEVDSLPDKTASGYVRSVLMAVLPHFMYFAHYDRMAGQVRIDTLEDRLSGQTKPAVGTDERVFIDFLEYAGTSLREIRDATTYESLNARCEAASNRITDQLLEYWTQNPYLTVEVRVTKAESGDSPPFNAGVVARARVSNTIHKASVPFSERSAGFIWFFSFLVKFTQVQRQGGALIMLLDEPGLTLHGKAQADLLRYIDDKLLPKHQVLFSTHSPFMVPSDNFLAVAIVEDRVYTSPAGRPITDGTKVRSDIMSVDRDTLFPLQGALGYEITQSLFVGKHTLLVEGPGDVLALRMLSSAVGRVGGPEMDRRWTVCPAGGIDKIQPFVTLFAGARLEVATLTDFARGDKKKLESLRQNRILESERLLTFAKILDLEEADLEDIFAPKLYLRAVNASLGLSGQRELTEEALSKIKLDTQRLVKRVEALCKLLPPEVPEFDHYRPMEWMFLHPEVFDLTDASVRETLSRAAAVIQTVNGLLPTFGT